MQTNQQIYSHWLSQTKPANQMLAQFHLARIHIKTLISYTQDTKVVEEELTCTQ